MENIANVSTALSGRRLMPNQQHTPKLNPQNIA